MRIKNNIESTEITGTPYPWTNYPLFEIQILGFNERKREKEVRDGRLEDHNYVNQLQNI